MCIIDDANLSQHVQAVHLTSRHVFPPGSESSRGPAYLTGFTMSLQEPAATLFALPTNAASGHSLSQMPPGIPGHKINLCEWLSLGLGHIEGDGLFFLMYNMRSGRAGLGHDPSVLEGPQCNCDWGSFV